jgi:hypothetical protein
MPTSVPGSLDENARRRFEAAWRHGKPELFKQFLPPEGNSAYLATLEEFVHIDLEFSWKASQASGDGASSADARPGPLLRGPFYGA